MDDPNVITPTLPSAAPASPDSPLGTGVDPAADGGEGSPDNGNQPIDADKVAKRVADTEAALKERQAELTRVSQELAAQKAVQAELARRETAATKDEGLKPFYQDEEWLGSFQDDLADLLDEPGATLSKALAQAFAKNDEGYAQLFQSRDEALLEQVRTIVAEATDPKTQALRTTMTALAKQFPWFNDLPSGRQREIAEVIKKSTGNGSDTLTPPATDFTGTGRAPAARAVDPAVAKRKAAEAKVKQLFPDLDAVDSTVITPTMLQPA